MNLAFCVADPPLEFQRDLPPVILLHGMLDSKMTWGLLAPKIATFTGRRVYYLDARNHGDSPWSDDFNFDILAEDLAEFMNARNIQKAVLIGHSMGGKTALTLAIRRPEKVDKLIVEDMTPRNLSSSGSGFVVQSLRLLRKALDVIPDGVDAMAAKNAIAQFMASVIPIEQIPGTDEEKAFLLLQLPIKQVGRTYAWKANLDALEKALVTKGNFDQKLSGQFVGETLFIYGGDSLFNVGRDEELIKQLFPKARLVAVEGAGHIIHHGHAPVFLKEVVNFINDYPTIRTKAVSKY